MVVDQHDEVVFVNEYLLTSVRQSVGQNLVSASPTLSQLKSTKCGKKRMCTQAKMYVKKCDLRQH